MRDRDGEKIKRYVRHVKENETITEREGGSSGERERETSKRELREKG